MDEQLKGLNSAQRIAVTSPSAILQILAPPGSGKTKTLTNRVAWHILNDGYHPSSVLVCTFTVKAAREMRDRLEGLLGKDTARKLILGTFHSVSRRFLVTYGKEIGLDPRFGIADSADSLSIVKRIIEDTKLTINPTVARNRISKLKAQSISPEQNHALTASKKASAEKQTEHHELTTAYALYEEHLKINNLLDYDDLLLRCADLLRQRPSSVAYVRAVLIDEFQDTNNVQFDLMTLFAQACRKISTVGDPDQSIYGWRSADVTNLRRMRELFPDLHSINLEENYRSSGTILARAQQVIEQDHGRPPKQLMPTHGPGSTPVFRTLRNAFREAQWLTWELRRTKALAAGLLRWEDYAILLRSSPLSRLIEQALAKEGIPYRMVGGLRFFDRAEVKIVLDYLRVINQPEHTDALMRILNVPTRGIGDRTMESLVNEATHRKLALWDLVLGIGQCTIRTSTEISSQARKGIGKFIDIIIKGRSRLERPKEEDQSLTGFIHFILQKVNLHQYLRDKYKEDCDSRWANVEELVALAVEAENQELEEEVLRFEEEEATKVQGPVVDADNENETDIGSGSTDGENTVAVGASSIAAGHQALEAAKTEPARAFLASSLTQFLSTVALSTDKRIDEGEPEDQGQVIISTMHAAKGLEWPVVFVPACYNGVIPHSRTEDVDEERRLLYVAMTRAQAMLYLSRPARDSVQKADTAPCPFIESGAGYHAGECFDPKGPEMTSQVIKEMATILGRPCPSLLIQTAARSATEHRKDDRIPTIPDDDKSDHEDYRFRGGFSKKRVRSEMDEGPMKPMGFRSAAELDRTPLSTDNMTVTSTLPAESPEYPQTVPRLERTASSTSEKSFALSKTKGKGKQGRLADGQQQVSSFFKPVACTASNCTPKPDRPGTVTQAPLQNIFHTAGVARPVLQAPQRENSEVKELVRPRTMNPASKGKKLCQLSGSLGVPPVVPGMKRHISHPGQWSRAT